MGKDQTVPYGTESGFLRYQALRAWLPSFCPSGTARWSVFEQPVTQ
jgi:hypothetical protein